MPDNKIVFQFRSWYNGAWSEWTNCDTDTYESMKSVAENDSSIQVRMHELPLQKDPQQGFINWWADVNLSDFYSSDPVVSAVRIAGKSWEASHKETEKEMLEVVAQAIYDQWRFMPGWEPWVPYGNSMRQTDARTLARNYRSTP